MTVSSAPPVELVSAGVSPHETTVYRELAESFSHTGPGLSDGLLSVGFGDVDAVSAMYPDHPPGLSVSSRDTCVPSVVALRQRLDHGRGGVGPHMNTTGPDVSDGPRETCVSSVDSQSRQSPGLGSGGLGPHCNTSDLPDDSRDFSASTGFFGVSTSVGTPNGDDDAVSAVDTNLSHAEKCCHRYRRSS